MFGVPMKQKVILTFFFFIIIVSAIFIKNKTFILPITDRRPCVYQAFGDRNQQLWVVSYVWSWKWISARHVIDPNYTEDLAIGTSSGQAIWFWENRQNIGNDIWLFELNDMTESGLHVFNERICDNSYNGLITYISGNLQKIPVILSGTFIDYDPDYGQSGSPLFSGWKIIWVISRKYSGGAIISLVP